MEMELFNISRLSDAIYARQRGREMAKEIGFGIVDQTRIAFTISELTNSTATMHEMSHLMIGRLESEKGEAGIELTLVGEDNCFLDLELKWIAVWSEEWDITVNRKRGTCFSLRKWIPLPYGMETTSMKMQHFALGEE
ncbi:hypothetical protein [Paenibacillus beijingensis]|uniref:Anti-sigma regulatory factor n=1 Tax=Paenibacillus beijingensis TaxID=1126833 RepID=A0A0D5NE92_9BACL|nr:hypothetical protein [Paenibacillus beijingensis]AJY73684.1 hypothetical protein VN24_02360 [Paenibacillus beijingensis]